MRNNKIFFLPVFFILAVLIITCVSPSSENMKQDIPEPYFVQFYQQGVFPYSTFNNTIDTCIKQVSPSTNYGTDQTMSIQLDSNITRSLIYFSLQSTIPSNAKIKRAFITLSVASAITFLETTIKIQMYAMNKGWGETLATWDTSGSESWNGINISGLTRISSASYDNNTVKSVITFEIPAYVVQGWLENINYVNVGVVLEDLTNGSYLSFYTKESTSAYSRPLLSVYYTLP